MIKQLLVCMALSSGVAHGMQQLSPTTRADTPPITANQHVLKDLGITIEQKSDKNVVAQQIVPCMKNFIQNKGPNISEVEQVLLLLKMVNRILPGKQLETGN